MALRFIETLLHQYNILLLANVIHLRDVTVYDCTLLTIIGRSCVYSQNEMRQDLSRELGTW